jgi:hypothetical protein
MSWHLKIPYIEPGAVRAWCRVVRMWGRGQVVAVTAAYVTITNRLRVVMTRLLAAAFWLGVGE